MGWVNGSYTPTGKKANIDNLIEANPKLSYDSIMEKVVRPNTGGVDFFIHTWNVNRKDELNDRATHTFHKFKSAQTSI